MSGPFHTKPDKSENSALFQLLGLPSTLISHENGGIYKRRVCASELTKNGAFRKLVRHYNPVISLPKFLIVAFQISWHSLDGKRLMRLQGKNTVFKFLRHSVEVA